MGYKYNEKVTIKASSNSGYAGKTGRVLTVGGSEVQIEFSDGAKWILKKDIK